MTKVQIDYDIDQLTEETESFTKEIARIKQEAEEKLIRLVLEQLLKRPATIQDHKKCSKVYGYLDLRQPGKYTLMYGNKILGEIGFDIFQGHQITFYPKR